MFDLKSVKSVGLKNEKIAYLLFILATTFRHVNYIWYGERKSKNATKTIEYNVFPP